MGQAKHAPTTTPNQLHSCQRAHRETGTRRAALASILALSTAAGASAIIVGDRALAGARGALSRWDGPPVVTPADPPPFDPDARIRALAAHLLPIAVELEPLAIEKARLWEAAFALAGGEAAHEADDGWHEALVTAQARVGYPAVYRAFPQASDALDAGVEALARMRPVTLMGFVAKARVAEHAPHLAIHLGHDLVALGDSARA